LSNTGKTWLWVPQAITCALLLWALYPNNSYGYYILLRWIVCPCLVLTAIKLFQHGLKKHGWGLVALALIFNPLLQIQLPQGVWMLIDIVGIGIAIWSVVLLKVDVPLRIWVSVATLVIGFCVVSNLTGLPLEKAILYFAGTETRGSLTVTDRGHSVDEYGGDHSGYTVEYSFKAGNRTIRNKRSYSGAPGYWSRPKIIYWKLAPSLINIPIGPEEQPTFFMSVIFHSVVDLALYGGLAFVVLVAYKVAVARE